ncbi:MAG: A/G-specific adenine glycosylase [Anaerolineales bacterium]|nr:A/G-specific adenine glycosylase [Anaerolineales bacterium]
MPASSGKLIAWSRRLDRALPWRWARDPYRIWVSEIMLQQTRTETAAPFFRRFVRTFPTVKALAQSNPREVLKAWEGLGYYARARNLHRAAVLILKTRGGRFPRTAAEWETLPGVGRYTAAAIASLARDEPAAALDSNAQRILARLFAYRRRLGEGRSQKDLAALYAHARGSAAPAAFFQALMDLGQLVCLPRKPLCAKCPVSSHCKARQQGIENRLPVRAGSRPIPHVDVAAAIIRRAGRILIAQRPEDKLLGGMWEFPGGKAERNESLPDCLRRELKEELGISVRVREKLLAVKHAFSHFRITLHVFRCDAPRGRPRPISAAQVRWVRIRDLGGYPMGRADRIVARRLSARRMPAAGDPGMTYSRIVGEAE